MHHHPAATTTRPTLVAVWTGRACRWVVQTPAALVDLVDLVDLGEGADAA